MLFGATVLDPKGFAEREVYLLRRVDLAVVLEERAVAPGTGRERDRDHRHSGLFREFYPDGVELLRVKDLRPGGLGEDDDRHARLQPLGSSLEHGLQVLAGVRAAHGNGVPRAHDVLEDRVVDKALFDDKGRVFEGGNDRGEDKCLERAYMVCDEHAGAFDGLEGVGVGDLELHPHRFKRAERREAVFTPFGRAVVAALCLRASPDNDGDEAGVKGERGQRPCHEGNADGTCPVGSMFIF